KERARLLARLQDEQRRGWPRGERVLVEAYLEQHPALRADAEGVLDLLYTEVVLREQCGEGPRADEYLRRFPHLAGPLRDQFELHGLLEADTGLTVPLTLAVPPSAAAGEEDGNADTLVPGCDVVGELGRGGRGVVYQVWQPGLGRMAALKTVLADGHAGPEHLARFGTEAAAAARLQHPHIVPIYEFGQHAGRPYMLLEYVAGGSLATKLDGTPL